jgi:hypothetical protein
MAKAKRDYRKEYDEYHGKPEQRKRRTARTLARRAAEKKGLVKKGDKSKEVHHVNAPRTGSLKKVKTRVVSKAYNRSKQPKRSK